MHNTQYAQYPQAHVFMLDNYDSFTYNLVHYLGEFGAKITVARNDEITVEKVLALNPSHVMISPGPCSPNESGISMPLIDACAGKIPLLGVCLGFQAIGQVFGGKVVRAKSIMHGKTSVIQHDGKGVFHHLKAPLVVNRYHSLAIAAEHFPAVLEVTSTTIDDGEIMGLRHRKFAIEGVLFHPESILTECGHAMLDNFLSMKTH